MDSEWQQATNQRKPTLARRVPLCFCGRQNKGNPTTIAVDRRQIPWHIARCQTSARDDVKPPLDPEEIYFGIAGKLAVARGAL